MTVPIIPASSNPAQGSHFVIVSRDPRWTHGRASLQKPIFAVNGQRSTVNPSGGR